jgi:hypothetical protein
MSDRYFNDRLDVRITEEDKKEFVDRCNIIDRSPPSVVREMIIAFNKRKIKIRGSNSKISALQEIYDEDR